MGLTLENIGFMYIGQFRDMVEEFKKWHNMRIRKQIFAEDEQVVAGNPEEVLK